MLPATAAASRLRSNGLPSTLSTRERMEEHAECMLVLIGATPEGRKELVGFQVADHDRGDHPLLSGQVGVRVGELRIEFNRAAAG